MSKMDDLRAMREARYARAGATPPVAPADPVRGAAPDAETLCGHRSMNGRTCTREVGHAATSHRYS